MNAYMMREFSDRTVAGLKQHKLFRYLLPPFKSFFEVNLEKEIDKHEQIISCAVDALDRNTPPGDEYTDRLLNKSREIDQDFLHKAHSFSSAIDIHYHEIDRIRRHRIEHIIEACYNILLKWQTIPRFREVIAELYTREKFNSFLREILHLYVMETMVLSRSVKIPRRLARFRDSLIDTVHTVMDDSANELAADLTGIVFGKE